MLTSEMIGWDDDGTALIGVGVQRSRGGFNAEPVGCGPGTASRTRSRSPRPVSAGFGGNAT